MTTMAIGLASVYFSDSTTTFEGMSIATDGPQTAVAHTATVTTPDEFRGVVAALDWQDGTREVRLIDFHAGPDAYRRLEQAGKMTTKATDSGTHVVLLRAMKFGGRPWPTLNQVTWAELERMCGTDPEQLLTQLGAVRTGTYGDLLTDVARYRDAIAVEVPAESTTALLAAFVLTRVLPIMHDFGLRDGLEPLA